MNDKTRKCVAFLFALLMMTSIPVVFATVSPHHSQEDIGDVSPVGTVQADHNESTNCQPENEGYTSSLGPCGMRHTNDTPPNASNPEFVIQKYATPASEGFVTGFVIVNDVVYASYATAFARGGRFVAYDLVANETLWTRTDGEFVNPSLLSSGGRHEGPSDTPSYTDVNGGMIIVPVMGPGKLIALDAQDGTTEWIFDPGADDANVDSHKFFSTAPQIYNGSAYYHVAEGISGGTWYSESHPWQYGFYKIDLTDGSIQWNVSGEDGGSQYHYRHGSIPTIIEDKYVAFTGTGDGTTVRYIDNGTEAFSLSSSMTTQAYNPQNNYILQVNTGNTLRAYDTSGTEVWNETLTHSYTTVNEWTGGDVDPNGYFFGESGSTVHSHSYEKPMQDIATKDDLVALGGMKGNWSLRYASNGTLISRTKVGSSSDTTGWVQSITFVGEDKLLLSVTAGQHRVYQYDISDASNPVEEWNFTRDGPDNEEPGVQGPVIYNKMAYWIETGYGNGDPYPSDPNFWRAGDLNNVPEESSTPTPTATPSSSSTAEDSEGEYDQTFVLDNQTDMVTIQGSELTAYWWDVSSVLEPDQTDLSEGDRCLADDALNGWVLCSDEDDHVEGSTGFNFRQRGTITVRDENVYRFEVYDKTTDGFHVTQGFTAEKTVSDRPEVWWDNPFISDNIDAEEGEYVIIVEGVSGVIDSENQYDDDGDGTDSGDPYLEGDLDDDGDWQFNYSDPTGNTTHIEYELTCPDGQVYTFNRTFDDPIANFSAEIDSVCGGSSGDIGSGGVDDIDGVDIGFTTGGDTAFDTVGLNFSGSEFGEAGFFGPPSGGSDGINWWWILIILAILAYVFRDEIEKLLRQ